MRRLDVALGARSYPIYIGAGVAFDRALFASAVGNARCFIVTNETIAPLYLEKLKAALPNYSGGDTAHVLPDGENYKHAGVLDGIYSAMLQARCDRTTVVVALGGGVVGDMAGYAAATYQRGVPFVQVPTTLLAQVDSSVGGKTGINHPLGKNMIGAFWQPRAVLADTAVLSTLPARELSAGLAEVIKYGLIGDLPFLDWIEAHIAGLLAGDPELLAEAVERSCANKAAVVAGDELETAKTGGRALLNLGHTFGHAIETGMGYGTWLHGEAVAAGTMMAATLSARLGWLDPADVTRIERLFEAARLPTRGPSLGAPRYLDLMGHDKKVLDGKLRLVLLKRLGEAVTTSDVTQSDIAAAIEACNAG